MLSKSRTTVIAGLAAVAALTSTGVASGAIVRPTTTSPVVAGNTDVTTAKPSSGGGSGSDTRKGMTCEQGKALAVGWVTLGNIENAAGNHAGALADTEHAVGIMEAACGGEA
jgi:hypothetical protein